MIKLRLKNVFITILSAITALALGVGIFSLDLKTANAAVTGEVVFSTSASTSNGVFGLYNGVYYSRDGSGVTINASGLPLQTKTALYFEVTSTSMFQFELYSTANNNSKTFTLYNVPSATFEEVLKAYDAKNNSGKSLITSTTGLTVEKAYTVSVASGASYTSEALEISKGYYVIMVSAGASNLYMKKFSITPSVAYSVTFDKNGASDSELSNWPSNGNYATIPNNPVRANYSFAGWSTSPNGEVNYQAGDDISQNLTLYAIWDNLKFDVSFNANGGSGTVAGLRVEQGETFTLPQNAFTRTGYTFLGWSKSSSDTTNYLEENSKYSLNSAENAIFYAVWKANTYTIEFSANGGTGEIENITATYDKNVTLPSSSLLTAPNSNSVFAGWQIGSSTYNSGASVKNLTSENGAIVTAVALWETPGYVTVTFYLNGGKLDGESSFSVEVMEGDLVPRPNNPEKDGSLWFGGWYTDNVKSSKGNKFDFEYDTVSSNKTLYALWIDPVDTESFQAYVDDLIDETAKNIKGQPVWATEGFKKQWNYIDGVFLNSIVNLYYNTGNEKYSKFFLDFVTNYVGSNGDLLNVTTGNKASYKAELDFICESKILFDAYALSKDEKYILAIEKVYDHLMGLGRVSSSTSVTGTYDGYKGNFEHKSSYDQEIWLDGMYMYAPFLARYLSSKNSTSGFYDLRLQYQFIYENMRDEKTGLLYHGYSGTSEDWNDGAGTCSHNFWLRSMGWFVTSLADCIEYFPEGDDKNYLISIFQSVMDSLLEFRDKDTYTYYQIINYGSYIDDNGTARRNYLETSGSAMIAYSLMKGGRLGYLKGDIDYREIGEKTFQGLYNHSLDSNTNDLYDICKQAGLDSSRLGTIQYYLSEPVSSNEGKGVGPFIMAFIEFANESPVTPTTPGVNKITVSFDSNGGSSVSGQSLYYSQTAIKPSNPSKSGTSFKHWSLYPSGEEFDFSTPILDDLTLYAVWGNQTVIQLTYSYAVGDTFKGASELSATNSANGYEFIGWSNDFGATVYLAGDNVDIAGEYRAIYAKAEYLGVGLRISGSTGVRFGFSISIFGCIDSQTLNKYAKNLSVTFNIVTSQNNKFTARNYTIDDGVIIVNAVIINDIDATKGDQNKCDIQITAKISVNFASGQTLLAEGANSISNVAKIAFEKGQISKETAEKYGYKG